jgi:gliding motility-associated-like protein
MPNAFTPNYDGINDVFRVKYPFPVQSFLLRIYDRFGEKVFESNDIHKGWTGTFKGMNALQGAYVWTISLVNAEGKTESGKGIVTLLR